MRQKVFFEDMGIRSYQPSWDYQEELLQKNTQIKWAARQNEQDVKTTNTEHRLLMVEHNPVFTLGKSGKREHVLVSEEQLKNLGIEFFHINRGDKAFDKQQWQIALGHYQRALKLDKRNHEVFFGLGKTYFKLGDVKRSYHFFFKSQSLNLVSNSINRIL